MSKKPFYFLILFLAAMVFLSACTLPWKKKNSETAKVDNSSENILLEEKKTDRLKKFADYKEAATFLSSHPAAPDSINHPEETMKDIAAFSDNPSSLSASADVLKQVDNIIYNLVKDELLVMKVESPEKVTLLGKMSFPFRPSGLFLEDGALVVYGPDEKISDSSSYKSRQLIRIFDISQPDDPRESRDLAFEGDLAGAFVRGGYLYLLTEKKDYDSSASVVPAVFENGQVLSNDCSSGDKCFMPPVFYFDSVYSSCHLLNISSINLKSPSEAISGQIYVLNENQYPVLAGENIYIFHPKSVLAEISQEAKKEVVLKRLDEENKKMISEIESAPSYLLSAEEKKLKVSLVIEKFINQLPLEESLLLEIDIEEIADKKLKEQGAVAKTIIHKLVPAGAAIDYFASSEAKGLLLSPDSVFDDGEYLYLATKAEEPEQTGDEKKYLSSVFVFDKILEPFGKLENIATKEEIAGARFIGQRAFLSSAKDGASIFVISLEDKVAPNYVGTLKVPGTNNYLRPVDANGNRFLSLSYENESGAGNSPVKLSLFDFSDLKQPKESDSFLIGDAGSDSIVFSDHNALYYSASHSVLSVPISFKEDGRLNFSGVLLFSVGRDSMELKGRVDHSAGGFFNQSDNFNGVSYRENTVRRSFFLNGIAYSFSNKFLRHASLELLDSAASLELSENEDDLLVSSTISETPESTEGNEVAGDMETTPVVQDPTYYPEQSLPVESLENIDGAFDLVPLPEENFDAGMNPAP